MMRAMASPPASTSTPMTPAALSTASAVRLVAEAATRFATAPNQDPTGLSFGRSLPVSPRGGSVSSPSARGGSTERTPLLAVDTRCPFRRSQSKPEHPTSNMGESAIAAESRRTPRRASAQKLVLLRKFSVSEEDVLVCNRVRCGVDPAWFRARSGENRRYQRSLSVEEARLVATRKRMSSAGRRSGSSGNLAVSAGTGTLQLPLGTLVVPENEPFDDETAVLSITRSVGSPRKQKQRLSVNLPEDSDDQDQDDSADDADDDDVNHQNPVLYKPTGSKQLTPREKAMHGRYLIRESFANGSYGQVCAGEDLPSHQEVAVKIIPKYILISPEEKQSVIREQVIHKSLDHPHIIKLIDVFEDDGAHYFILERATNGSLSAIMSYAGMPEDRARDVFHQLLLALEYLHRHNIVHHDIKPNNILLQTGNAIKLCDFGASRAFSKDETSLPFAGVFGTPGYIAPELLLGENAYGSAIDMFSSGILLFEMVFGYTPFYPPSACTYQPLGFPPKSEASARVRHLIGRLLEKDPATRMTASQALGHPWITRGVAGRSAPNSPLCSPVCSPRAGMSPRARARRPLERCLSS